VLKEFFDVKQRVIALYAKNNKNNSLLLFFLFLLLFLLAATLRFYQLDAQSLWSDEGNSVAMAPRPALEIIQRTANDIHPPLYYLTLHGWSAFTGTSVIAVRSLSVIFGVITVILTALLGKRLFGWRVAFFAMLAATVAPFAIHYSQETRMYMMVTMLAAASWLLLIELFTNQNADEGRVYHLLGYFVITLALIYTHYYAVSVVVAQNVAWLWVMIRAKRWQRTWWVKWIVLQALIVLLYLPWLWYARDTILNWPSISDEITLSFIARQAFQIFSLGLATDGMGLWQAVGFGLLLMSGLLALKGKRPSPPTPLPIMGEGREEPSSPLPLLGEGLGVRAFASALPLFYCFIPIAFMLILSLDRPFWNPKFLLLALPGYHLLLGMGAVALMKWVEGWNRALMMALGVIISAFLLLAAWQPLQNEYSEPRFWRDDYRAMMQLIEAQATAQDAILLDGAGQQEVVTYYLTSELRYYALPATQPLDESATRQQLEAIAAEHERLFVLWWAEQEGDPTLFIPRWLDEHAFEAGSRWFGDVRLATYRLGELPPPEPLNQPFTLRESTQELRVVGASIDPQTVISGDVVAINSLWSASTDIDSPITFFAQLLDMGHHVVGQYDGDGGAPPVLDWSANTEYTLRMGVPLAVGTPPGDYRLIIGAYHSDNGQRLLHPDGDAYQLAIMPVRAPLIPPTLDALGLRHNEVRDVAFGDITLVGARSNKLGFDHAPDTPLAAGEPFALLLFWRAEQASPPVQPFSLQLHNQNGTLITEWPLDATEGRHPPENWSKGSLIRDPQTRFLPHNIEPATYQLILSSDGIEAEAAVGQLVVQ